MMVLTLFVQSGLADGVLQSLGKSVDLLSNSFNASDLSTAAHSTQVNASQQLVHVSQLDPAQYSSPEEYNQRLTPLLVLAHLDKEDERMPDW